MRLERLTECEQMVMKTIWNSEEELSLMEIRGRVNNKYNKDWRPQTVSSFLARLVRKGYLKHYRQGRLFFYQILVPLEEYKGQITNDFLRFWNHDNVDEFLSALMKKRQLRPDEIERIRNIIGQGTINTHIHNQEIG